MTQDLFLKFATPETMLTALQPLGMTYIDADGNEHASQGSHQFALWWVGQIPGKDGYHVNLRVLDPSLDVESLLEYQVNPRNPVCVWA